MGRKVIPCYIVVRRSRTNGGVFLLPLLFQGYGRHSSVPYKGGAKFDGENINDRDGNGFPIVFLLKGPRGSGASFWHQRGIVPLIKRIREALSPASVRHWYPGAHVGNVIEVDWSSVE